MLEPTTNREQRLLVGYAEVRRRKSRKELTDEEPANCASECIRQSKNGYIIIVDIESILSQYFRNMKIIKIRCY